MQPLCRSTPNPICISMYQAMSFNMLGATSWQPICKFGTLMLPVPRFWIFCAASWAQLWFLCCCWAVRLQICWRSMAYRFCWWAALCLLLQQQDLQLYSGSGRSRSPNICIGIVQPFPERVSGIWEKDLDSISYRMRVLRWCISLPCGWCLGRGLPLES